MSIPPLVCSTPPPPDQCEEDKDPEDFDISYNLSQDDDDDDDGYNYTNLSSYNNFQTSLDTTKNINLCDNVDITNIIIPDAIYIETTKQKSKDEQHSMTNIKTESKVSEEYKNIEDLRLEINQDSICTNVKDNVDSSISEINVVNEFTEDHLRTLSPSPITDENSFESMSVEDKTQTSKDVLEAPELELDVSLNGPGTLSSSNSEAVQDLCMDTIKPKKTNLEEDFDDFDDFKFADTEIKSSPYFDNCENPWENNETENTEFGNFTANFEAVEELKSGTVTEIMEQDIDVVNNEKINECNEVQNKKRIYDTSVSAVVDDDDDFGDFDDFKSTAIDNETCSLEFKLIQEGPGIDFHLSDNESQVMESITKVLSSVFTEEVREPETQFEGKLETMLSESWRHLRETDVRQPYIMNWNNSLGQKTLLRALCIDSRNILFGPKWGYSMPKYAVNLSNAPLQPQKPLTPAAQSENSSEKSTSKSGGWVDPFTSDGQESCKTENESVVEVTPSELDVFEAAVSTKSDKIYSSTLKVQPLRQINLPDTHIFTPTDSETPRSKTIHYDSGPPILLPQPVLETNKSVENFPFPSTETSNKKDGDDDNDWEFQDFRGSTGGAASATASQPIEPRVEDKSETISKPSITYQTQVLQPIKMEPLMPSLNWPDPGEVKETFEDFSDFVSKTSWSNETSHITPHAETNTLEQNNDRLRSVEIEPIPQEVSQTKICETFDDEFNTFQSAPLPNQSMGYISFNCSGGNTLSIPYQGTNQSPLIKEFDYTLPKIDNYKSETISVDDKTRPNEALTQSLGFTTPVELTTNKNSLPLGNPISSNILQPLPITSNTSQKNQKTAQILQPLSLESYSQINWPNPGIDLQDLSRFNPVETLQSLKTELSASGSSKGASPAHTQKNTANNQVADDDIWGEFVSSKPKQQTIPKKAPVFVDDDEWTDFVSSPSVKSQNGLNTISLNVHTNSNIQKTSNSIKFSTKNSKVPLDIPTLNYITSKSSSGHSSYNDRHFQNL